MSSIFKSKKGLGRGLSSLIGDTKKVSKSNKMFQTLQKHAPGFAPEHVC